MLVRGSFFVTTIEAIFQDSQIFLNSSKTLGTVIFVVKSLWGYVHRGYVEMWESTLHILNKISYYRKCLGIAILSRLFFLPATKLFKAEQRNLQIDRFSIARLRVFAEYLQILKVGSNDRDASIHVLRILGRAPKKAYPRHSKSCRVYVKIKKSQNGSQLPSSY